MIEHIQHNIQNEDDQSVQFGVCVETTFTEEKSGGDTSWRHRPSRPKIFHRDGNRR